jgi:small subunit ribosomal protein S17
MADTIERNMRKERQGVVVSDANDKTIVVRIERRTTHPLYGKTMTRTKKYHVHDEANEAGVGDTVRITETRPISKNKRWRLTEIVERAK